MELFGSTHGIKSEVEALGGVKDTWYWRWWGDTYLPIGKVWVPRYLVSMLQAT